MSDIREEDENDPAYRRQMLYSWAVIAKERDDLVDQLNKELEDHETLKFNKERIDALIEEIRGKDIVLTSSRFSRVLHNVTQWDRIIVGVRTLFSVRKAAAVEVLSAVLLMVMVVSITLQYQKLVDIFHKVFGSLFVARAYAETKTAEVTQNLDPTQLAIIVGAGVLIGAGFLWFTVTATLSKSATTRRAAMDMAKHVMVFMMGLIGGYLANSHPPVH